MWDYQNTFFIDKLSFHNKFLIFIKNYQQLLFSSIRGLWFQCSEAIIWNDEPLSGGSWLSGSSRWTPVRWFLIIWFQLMSSVHSPHMPPRNCPRNLEAVLPRIPRHKLPQYPSISVSFYHVELAGNFNDYLFQDEVTLRPKLSATELNLLQSPLLSWRFWLLELKILKGWYWVWPKLVKSVKP